MIQFGAYKISFGLIIIRLQQYKCLRCQVVRCKLAINCLINVWVMGSNPGWAVCKSLPAVLFHQWTQRDISQMVLKKDAEPQPNSQITTFMLLAHLDLVPEELCCNVLFANFYKNYIILKKCSTSETNKVDGQGQAHTGIPIKLNFDNI